MMNPNQVVVALSDAAPDASDNELSAEEALLSEKLMRQLSTQIEIKRIAALRRRIAALRTWSTYIKEHADPPT